MTHTHAPTHTQEPLSHTLITLRATPADRNALDMLCDHYAARLKEAGYEGRVSRSAVIRTLIHRAVAELLEGAHDK